MTFDPRPRPCPISFAEFDHRTVYQAEWIQRYRLLQHDEFIATHKIARVLGCTREQIEAFMERNPHPRAAA